MHEQATDVQTAGRWYRQFTDGECRKGMEGLYRQTMNVLSLIGFSNCSLNHFKAAALVDVHVAAYMYLTELEVKLRIAIDKLGVKIFCEN